MERPAGTEVSAARRSRDPDRSATGGVAGIVRSVRIAGAPSRNRTPMGSGVESRSAEHDATSRAVEPDHEAFECQNRGQPLYFENTCESCGLRLGYLLNGTPHWKKRMDCCARWRAERYRFCANASTTSAPGCELRPGGSIRRRRHNRTLISWPENLGTGEGICQAPAVLSAAPPYRCNC
jgi:hypothetical protein